jgi:PAS domain S-box-containing protein
MFESFVAVPLHFTIEFFGLLVLAGGMTLVLTRPALIPGAASNRVTAALGFAALAAGQVLHGGSFSVAQSDSDQLLVTLQTLGVALLLVAVVGGVKTAAGTGAFFNAPGALIPGAAWAMVAIMSLVGAARGGPRAFRRLALASVAFAASSLLTAATPKTAEFGVGDPSAYLFFAHATKLVAFLLLGVWLWAGVRTSIRARFVASFGALLLGVVLILSTALTTVISDNIEGREIERVGGQVSNVVRTIEEDQTLDLKRSVEQIASASPVQEGFLGQGSLETTGRDIMDGEIWEMDFIAFLSPRGDLIAYDGLAPVTLSGRPNRPVSQRFMLRVPGSEVPLEVVRSGRTSSASVLQIQDSAVIVAAARSADPASGARTIGVVVLGQFLDQLFVEELDDNLAVRASVLVGNTPVASTLPTDEQFQDLVPQEARGEIRQGVETSAQLTVGEQTFYGAFGPLHANNGRTINATVLLSAPSSTVVDLRQELTRILFLVAMVIGAVALFLAWLSGRRITRPIQELTRTAQTVREGDLAARAEVVGEDEVGELGETFNEMTASLFRMTDDLRDAARQEHDLRARIETIIQSMADGLVAVDSDGNVLAFNREAENITGVKASSAMGKPIEKVLRAVDNQETELKLPIYDLAEGSLAGVFVPRRTGENIPVAITSAVLRDEEGEISGAVAVLRDMTREREIERMKSEFLSNISHELRTPLTPIKGYAEILARKQVPAAKMKQFVGGILDSTERLERIVGLLVDFSAMEAGRLSPRAAPVDVGEIVKKLAEDWGRKAKQHEVVVDVKPRLPKVFGDERLLRRSIEEVIDNAVKFSPQGGTITLEAKSSAASNGKGRAVTVTVTDEGIGIQPKDLSKIFSDFHQLDGSETRTYGGLGLGLAFVQRIVEAHAGKIEVKSEPEKGTKLTITIPARSGD